MHNANDLLILFDHCFLSEFNTVLMGGGDEPIYLPADEEHRHHRIVFSHDYFASALHEIAHWCVAGEQRRAQVDYGYWYAPDGRTEQQQASFELVEIKPQAIEWLFTEAAGAKFKVSADNLSQGLGPSDAFKGAIALQARAYCEHGLSARPIQFIKALQAHYGVVNSCDPNLYSIEKI